METGVVTDLVIADGAIDAGTFKAGAITSTTIAADAITSTAIAADAITAEKLDTQVSVEIADQVITKALTDLGLVIASGTIGATGNTTTALHLAGLAYANDAINSMTLVIKDVSTGLFYSRWIEDWADTGDLATVATLPFTPQASTDLYWILPTRADVTGGSGLDAAGVRAALGLASANLDTQLDALPTNAELATALGTADDAVLAAIAALNNLSQANIRTALGMATANLDTQIGDLPTNAELTTALGTADDAVLAAIAALNNLSQANVRTAVGLASANLDTQLAAMATAAALATVAGYVDTEVAAIKAKTDNLPTDPADASDIAASFVSIASTLSTLASYVDTEVAAIKAKTDSLTFTIAGAVDANIQRVNDVAVVGTGAPGDEWGA
jgi:cell division protein ZapA (FtsZ GTPase activity inhibitor)